MPLNLSILKSKGVTVEKLNGIFTKERSEMGEKPRAFIDRLRQRIQNGINFNCRNYKTYHALDMAWDIPFRQISPTLMGMVIGKDPTNSDVVNQVRDLGLTSLIQFKDIIDPKTGHKSKAIDKPYFYEIAMPLVRAYLTIRWAKITNDRKLTPLFKYEPLRDTPKNRLRGEVVTDRVQMMSTQYGYYDVLKQAVFHMLHYSFCLQFPVEEWHQEEQLAKASDEAEPKPKRTKEGLRYHLPHPTRTFWDENHRLSTFNSDTGCEFAGYWRIVRYGDIKNNDKYWNKDKVNIGSRDWAREFSGFFLTTAQASTMQFPDSYIDSHSGMALDREKIMADALYTNDLLDSAVTVTEFFEKLVPSEYGFGDYDYPVWFRFVIAADDTVLYAAPLPYSPVVYYGYDAVESRAQNASLSLEILPFQDQCSNLLSQLLLSTKQNLANITFVDTDQVDEPEIQKLEGWGERHIRSINFMRYSSRKWRTAQNDKRDAFQSWRFPQLDTTSIINAIKVVLDLLERTLVMSAQEVAQAASHEQTREEVRNIAQTTSTRLTFTANPVDVAIVAWKKQIYDGIMQFGDEETYAQVDGEYGEVIGEEELEKLGFSVQEKSERVGDKMVVHAKNKTAIAIEAFSSTRDGDDRIDNVAAATAIAQFMQTVLTNPILAPAIGAEQAVTIMNTIGRMAGFPRDFKLRNVHPTGDLMEEEKKKQDEEARTALMQTVNEIVQKNVVQATQVIQQGVTQQVQPIGQAISDLAKQIDEVKGGFGPVIKGIKDEQAKNAAQEKAIEGIVTALEQVQQAVEPIIAILQQTQPPQPTPPDAQVPQNLAPIAAPAGVEPALPVV